MPKSYRLTLYENGLIDRMLPFEADDRTEAVAFAERERYGHHAVLSNRDGVVERFADNAFKEVAARLRRPPAAP